VARAAGWTPDDLARAFLNGGARFIQIRAKHLASGPLLDLCDAIVRMAAPFDAAVIVNDRADIARLSGAAGVHVGQDDLEPAAAREQLGAAAVIGYSTHELAQVEAARTLPVTYIAVGPVFGTATKDTGYAAVGLALVSGAVRDASGLPIVGIGGITLETAPLVLSAGATSVAVISDLLAGGDPQRRVAAYLQRLEETRRERR
jgi:thiamine-phosphate pyrophosphorylase